MTTGDDFSPDRVDRRLVAFMNTLEGFLEDIVRSGRDPTGTPLFIAELYRPMVSAWREVRPMFDTVREAIPTLSDERIVSYGLYGEQLDFKLATIDHFSNRFRRFGGFQVFRRLLEAVDNLLESILAAVGVGEAIAEFKKGLEISTNDV